MDPNLFKLTNVRHNERLQNAATARHFRQAGLPKPGLQERALQSLGGLLVALGQKLKALPQSNTATPAFGER
ncbi:MAG: hypothetical protein GWO38_19635 [Phycisphaerae bacterium]|nr:hypothetical protein [Phycisphaerae bacterium]NIX29780.1 hypothetical protein [Phycisphaerae bacterium]